MHLPAKIVTSDDPTDPKWWVTDGVVRQHIKNREHAAVLISIGNATAQSGTGDLSKAREIVPYTWPGTVIDSIRPVTAGGSITTAAVTT